VCFSRAAVPVAVAVARSGSGWKRLVKLRIGVIVGACEACVETLGDGLRVEWI
jgi:hypothetical protein